MTSTPPTFAVDAATGPTALFMRGVTKRFGPVVACDDVTLEVARGQIHGLLGENGAGKSTLMKILTGLLRPDVGSIGVGGVETTIRSPHHAAELGIAMVHQHLSLIPQMTVWENFVLGETGAIRPGEARRRIVEVGQRYGLDVDPYAFVGDLTAGQRQRVEIVKCFRSDPGIIVLDEPTSVLTDAESVVLFDVLRRVVAEERRAVVLISHKLDEIMRATDSVTVMRRGRVVHSCATEATDKKSLAIQMVGRPVAMGAAEVALGMATNVVGPEPNEEVTAVRPAHYVAPVGPVLEVCSITVMQPGRARPVLDELSLSVAPGEILGIAGVEGNGQVALQSVLAGLQVPDRGQIRLNGISLDAKSPGTMAHAGISVITEDRHADGCALSLSVEENLNVFDLESLSTHGVLDRRRRRRRAEALIERFGIRCPSPDTPMAALSGGNQQRVVLARELSRNPKVVVAVQPTRGLDVGAIEFMLDQLRAAADAGAGVVLISTELDEVLGLSTSVAVISRGRIVGQRRRADIDMDEISMMLGGSQLAEPDAELLR